MRAALKRLGIVLALSMAGIAFAAPSLIIKYKPTPTQAYDLQSGKISAQGLRSDQMKPLSSASLNQLSSVAGIKIHEVSQIATGAHVIALPEGTTDSQTQQIIKSIEADPSVAYVEENRRVYAKSIPELNPVQWDMQESFTTSAIHPTWQGDNLYNVSNIPNIGLPGSGVVVGVLDTGYTPHQDFLSNLVGTTNNYGYQFISDCITAGMCPVTTPQNKINIAYVPNALDQGDYLTQAQINASNGFFSGCDVEETSSWHGSHVTGTIIAQGYSSGAGIVGGAYGATVVPVRVLGKCGGYLSDIANAVLWVAGIAGVPNNANGVVATNPKPADIISMSLGSTNSCGASAQDVINTVTANGTNGKVFVVAAGNEASNVSTASPANCQNVISVAAKGPTNSLAYYSNYGATSITASGGDKSVSDPGGKVYSTLWSSPRAYSSSGTGIYDYYQGTSMATPHVSAAVADIMSVLRAKGVTWNTASIIAILQNSADNLNNPCISGSATRCVTRKSALNATNAVIYAQSYQGSLTPSATTVTFAPGATGSVVFTNSNSDAVTITSTSVVPANISASQGCNRSIPSGGTCTVTLSASTATGGNLTLLGNNNIAVATVTVSVAAPAAPSSSGGGGCTAIANGDDVSLILLLLSFSAIYVFRKKYLKLKRA